MEASEKQVDKARIKGILEDVMRGKSLCRAASSGSPGMKAWSD
jgi:hypothetical protein